MPTLQDFPNLSHEKFAGAGTSAISRFSVKSSSHSGRPSLLFLTASTRQFLGASSLLHELAGFNEIYESCGGDVEEEIVLGLDDSPGTTREARFSFLQRIFFPLVGQTWLTTTET